MTRQAVNSPEAPAPVGPYSHAVRAGEYLFCSGQIPVDPASGKLVTGDVAAATEMVLKNLSAVLEAAGAKPADVVKTTVFLADLGDFAAVNEVYARFFGESKPARACAECSRLPKDAPVMIEAVAYLGD